MYNGTKYLWKNKRPEEVIGDDLDFAEIGEDLIESEELTNKVYEAYLSMIVKKWSAQATKKEFHLSDIGLVYTIGPYIPCVKRMSYTRSIDINIDGIPGIQVTAMTLPGDFIVSIVRPFKPPREVCFVDKTIKTYKYISMWKKEESDEMDSLVLFFGINKKGYILSPIDKRDHSARPWMMHGAVQLFPALDINSHFDSRNLWLANTTEDIGYGESQPLRFRLGLSKEHIKSLFYARKLPITETGRKRPILHWVRAHERRIKEGVDIDISAHLRGIIEFNMDGLRFQITQPDKTKLHKADPETIKEAFRLYSRST